MKRSASNYPFFCFILSSLFFCGIDACWGEVAPEYGIMNEDYDLLVGSDLVLNCTLNKLSFPKKFPRNINSSDLVIEKGHQEFDDFTKILDDHTIQLRIPNATVNDSGIYICKIFFSKEIVCPSKVNVGYPPFPVQNFSCISRNFDNLYCNWSTEINNVFTTYTITKNFRNIAGLPQKCPDSTKKPNSCAWTRQTNPVYEQATRNLSFVITGKNSLGEITQNFSIDGYSIVIPNSPENLEILHIGQQSATIKWKPPTMRNLVKKYFPLKYQIRITKVLYDSSDFMVYGLEGNTTQFTLENLIPYVTYNVSVRCQSVYARKSDMWSNFTSLMFETLADVPYKIPEVIPEAFELQKCDDSRCATLYWKAVPEVYHNGEAFHYHIEYYQNNQTNTSTMHALNTNVTFIKIKSLQKNSSYVFRIHSANEKGISKDYGSIFIDSEAKIPPAPREVRVISQDISRYNLTWIPPNDMKTVSYIVFWCASLKNWLPGCDSSIHWIEETVSETNIVLKLSDIKTNFKFAVASKTEASSSGMQWASCIIPPKGLSKINFVHVEPKSSTTMKVIWNLVCEAEKAVLSRYRITYCGVDKHKQCDIAYVNSSADNFLLENLHPFTKYSIKIRAINNDNKSSEDSDEVYESTLPGAPSDYPQNIHVSSIRKDAFFVSWTPPLEPNGIITKYVVSYNGSRRDVGVASKYDVKIDGLKPFSTYVVQIQACVNRHCSIKSEPIMIRTEVDEPGYMEPPRIEEVNSTHFKVSWTKPLRPNGPIDFYVIKWHRDEQNSTIMDNKLEVSGANSVVLNVKCPFFREESIKYLFYVQAVNKKNGTNLYGPFSKSTQAKACSMPEGSGMFIGIIVGTAVGLVVFLIIIYQLAKCIKRELENVPGKIVLPNALEEAAINPLDENESKKNGNENVLSNNNEYISYIMDESKNRHGSGSSQFSNSSVEELSFRNGKCPKFARKPSGDSSGCSSMSSSITTRNYMSYDSGNESDFVIPPSPDSAITEISLQNPHKPPLPILMEVNDQNFSEKSLQQTMSPEKQYLKHKNGADAIILKVDPPYSKFGYTGNTNASAPRRVNSLAFYNCNLANSEPSVFDTEKKAKSETVFAPYSKVGLAKSSGDIGLANVKQNGYSKFGFPTPQKTFSMPPSDLDVINFVMLENPNKSNLPTIKKFLAEKYSQNPLHKNDKMTPSNNLAEDTGYIKVGKSRMCANTSTKGYVPFNEIKNQMDHNQSILVNNSDQSKMLNSSFDGKESTGFPDDTEWFPFNHREEENSSTDSPENEPFSQSSTDCIPLDGSVFLANNYGSNTFGYQNSNESLSEAPHDPKIKLNSDSPALSLSEISFENNSVTEHRTSSLPNSILNPTGSVFEESHLNGNTNNKKDCYDTPNEVIVTPVTLKNGYVPFHSLSDSMCDKTQTSPNNSKLRNPVNGLPHSVCSETNNYISSTDNGDLKFCRQNSPPKTIPFVSPTKTNSLNDTQKCLKNGNGYSNLSLKYILKPLPKMESEVCEV